MLWACYWAKCSISCFGRKFSGSCEAAQKPLRQATDQSECCWQTKTGRGQKDLQIDCVRVEGENPSISHKKKKKKKKKTSCGQWEAVFNLRAFLPEPLCFELSWSTSLLISVSFVVWLISQISWRTSKLYKDKLSRDLIISSHSEHTRVYVPASLNFTLFVLTWFTTNAIMTNKLWFRYVELCLL